MSVYVSSVLNRHGINLRPKHVLTKYSKRICCCTTNFMQTSVLCCSPLSTIKMDEGDVTDYSKLPDGVQSCYQLCVSALVIYGMPVLFWLVFALLHISLSFSYKRVWSSSIRSVSLPCLYSSFKGTPTLVLHKKGLDFFTPLLTPGCQIAQFCHAPHTSTR